MWHLPIQEVLVIKLTSLSSSWASDTCGIALRGITRKWTGAWRFMSSKATHYMRELEYARIDQYTCTCSVVLFYRVYVINTLYEREYARIDQYTCTCSVVLFYRVYIINGNTLYEREYACIDQYTLYMYM